MTTLAPEPEVTVQEPGESLTHWVCLCSPFIALCGTEVTGQDLGNSGDGEGVTCVVCDHLEDFACPRCGW